MDLSRGLPGFTVVGLPGAAVRESRERIRAALVNRGFGFPLKRITVNLAPAELHKDGTAFDLPIALGLLAAVEAIPARSLDRLMVVGELALDGTVRPVRGVLPAALEARRRGLEAVLVPSANAAEARMAGLRVLAAGDLREAASLAAGGQAGRGPDGPPAVEAGSADDGHVAAGDFAEVRGLPSVLRALEIAASGRHNVLLVGPPGAGKTMLARRLPGILPPLAEEEALEVTEIHSVAGLLENDRGLVRRPPFRAPHCSATPSAVLGGGNPLRPGEATLAHRGVLFLDEFPEFSRAVREGLRAPLSDGHIAVTRVRDRITLPADVQLVAAANPCPCGHWQDPLRPCRCGTAERQRYRARLSGPIADRIDLHVSVRRVLVAELGQARSGPASAAMAARVSRVRAVQRERHLALGCGPAGRLPLERVTEAVPLDPAARAVLHRAAATHGVSARGAHLAVRVARTIADLDGAERVSDGHLIEALGFRPLDSAGDEEGHGS